MRIRRMLITVFALWAPLVSVAAGSDALTPGEDLAALERFLSLSDAELDTMQAAIARVRAMTPEERKVFRERIVAFRGLPAVRRDEIRADWGWVSEEDRNDWRRMMQSLAPEDRSAIHARMAGIPATERAAFKHAILKEWRADAEEGSRRR